MGNNVSEIFGWLTPNNSFEPCEAYQHMEVIRNLPEAMDIPEISKRFLELDEINKECKAKIDADKHPNWHIYEIAESALKDDLYSLLLKHRFIRMGEVERTNIIHFEATPETIKDKMQTCIDFAENLNKGWTFEPQKIKGE